MSNTENPFPVKRPPVAKVELGSLSERPLVSIIIPSFNQGRYIKATLDSIIEQDYRPIEIVCMDGGSKDETVSVLESYSNHPELRWVSKKDRGVVHAVNKGFAAIKGEIIGIQSSDDCYLPGTIARIVREFQQKNSVGLIYGNTTKVDEFGKEIQRNQIGPYSLENIFLLKSWIPQPSTFFRRPMLDACGGWDESIPYAPDTDLWIRMAFRTDVIKLDEYLSQRRMHGEQRDTQVAKIVRDYTKMIEQSPDIQSAPPALRAAALASPHLIRQRYNPTKSDWSVAWHLLRAGLHCGKAWNLKGISHHLLLPFRRVASRLKKSVVR